MFYLFIYLFWYLSVQLIYSRFTAILINLLYQIKYVCMHARMNTTARACGFLLNAHLAALLASKIRLALLVVNSVELLLSAYKCDLSRQKSK